MDERISTGIPGFDDILNGGLPKNRLYLVEGFPGTGKTTMALQFLLEGVRQGEKVLYVSLSETREEIEQVAASHHWSLKDFDLYELSQIEESLLQENQENTIFHTSDVELSETTKRIVAKVEASEPQRVVLDSLSEMRLLAGDPLRYRRQILAFKQFFAGRQCTVLLLDDRTSGEGDLQLQSISHGVLMLEEQVTDHSTTRRRARIVKMRGSPFLSGFHDYEIETGGLVVYPRLVASISRANSAAVELPGKKALSGRAELDALLGGGLEYGTSALILGPAGAGKSSISTQFLWTALERGERTACYLFEEARPIFLRRSAGLGMDFKKFLDSGMLMLHQIDPASLSPGQFFDMIKRTVEKQHVSMLIIDSINGYLNAMPTEKHLLLQLHELLMYLNHHHILTLMIMAQHGMLGSMMSQPIDVSYLADTVILLRFFEMTGRVKKAISVVKRRIGIHENTIRELAFSSDGIKIGPPLIEFQGVLTGVPEFVGTPNDLIKRGP